MCQGPKSAGTGGKTVGGKGSVVLLGSSASISFALFYFIFMLPHCMVAPGAKYYFNTYSAGVPSEPSQAGNMMSTECGPLVGQRETTYFTTIQRAMEIAIVRSC